MRSSKSRSRGKNRSNNRSPANNLNRVFDSSGPEGKVRGTPQQIIDKYTQLARDNFMSGDRVAAENFQQHAEHYTRLLAEAQRDAEEKRAQADQQNRERQAQRQREREDRDRARDDRTREEAKPAQPADPGSGEQPDVILPASSPDTGLVETPEAEPKPKKRTPRSRKPRAPKVQDGDGATGEGAGKAADEGTAQPEPKVEPKAEGKPEAAE
ncbi:MAG TPA: DUF4167 domain-containing protein [Rhodobacterales bacterium]|nr:DUF4167 domain-containing protein [Rhodobacterales bacterium]